MELILAHCSAAFNQHGSLFAIFFLGGLTGSFTHCFAMCGPMVAGPMACAGGCSQRTAHRSQWTFHLGRMTSYGALGFIAALMGKQVAAYAFWPALSSAMLCIAAAIFIASSLPHKAHSRCTHSARTSYLRGALTGFMPCGLLYAALMVSATLPSPYVGFIAMCLFTLGTMPALLMASGTASLLSRKWHCALQNAGRAMMAFNGLTLLVLATKGMR